MSEHTPFANRPTPKSGIDRALDAFGKVVGVSLVNLLMIALTSMVFGLFLMLAVGVVHHQWIEQCPTIGYWWACLLAGLIRATLYQLPERD